MLKYSGIFRHYSGKVWILIWKCGNLSKPDIFVRCLGKLEPEDTWSFSAFGKYRAIYVNVEIDKTGLTSHFIQQPSSSIPEGPQPHLERTAGRDRTHATTDEGCCTVNYATDPYVLGLCSFTLWEQMWTSYHLFGHRPIFNPLKQPTSKIALNFFQKYHKHLQLCTTHTN